MKKIIDIPDLRFTPGAAGVGQIQFFGDAIPLECVQLITNLTRAEIIYQFNSTTRGASAFNNATSTIVLKANTATHSAGDVIQAIVDLPDDAGDVENVLYGVCNGYPVKLRADQSGGLILADNAPSVIGSRPGLGTLVDIETTGSNSIVVQMLNGFGSLNWTVSFQASNDRTTWNAVAGWPIAGASDAITTANAAGQWIFPTLGRFFRVQCTTFASGLPTAICVSKNQYAFFPARSPAVNISQIAGSNVVNAGLAGVFAIGGNVAVGSAPTTNPISLAWDGTNTRRILTDPQLGGVVLGSNAGNNGQTAARFNQTAIGPGASQIKATPGRLTMLSVSNNGTVAGFLHFYNAATVTLGTTNDLFCVAIPASVGTLALQLPEGGLYFSNGIAAAFTNGSASNDNTAFGTAPSLTANYAFI